MKKTKHKAIELQSEIKRAIEDKTYNVKEIQSKIWTPVDIEIDFNLFTPFDVRSSLHLLEERYNIEGKVYRLLYAVGIDDIQVELLIE